MAWQYPTHICGHAGDRYQAYGPESGRKKQLAAIERQECPACRRTKAEAEAQAKGLPALVGSDKQVAWASEIRERALRLDSRAATLAPETSAKWWIDNRDRWA